MTPYGKTAQTAIAAVSRLAEVHEADPPVRLSSAQIAVNRQHPKPLIAKVLTILSQAGIVAGSPGPGGGYWLAKHPKDISLYDVVILFEKIDESIQCPFGPQYCGNTPHCPMHFDILKMRDQMAAFLQQTNFERFILPPAKPKQAQPLPAEL